MVDDKLLENYYNSLSHKYNAVCLDINGTITEKGKITIDQRFISNLADLLNKRIPVVFVTGRGETCLNELKNEILPSLKRDYKIEQKKLSNLYLLTNDGARLFSSTKNGIFEKSEYISSENEFKQLADLDIELAELFNDTVLSNYCDLSYSHDSINNKILNIRLVMKTKNEKIIGLIKDVVESLTKKNNYNNLKVTIGVHQGDTVIQLGTILKGDAIKVVEKIIGIPENSMLRIGDCGDNNGNDYSMLDCFQGFSVDKISGKNNACFPIIDENCRILKGCDATLYLLKKAKILPTICLENALEKDYRKGYSLIEKNINLGRKTHLKKFNDLFNSIFNEYDGIYSVFDINTGSIKIQMYDLELIDDGNPLKKFWLQEDDKSLKYSMFDNDCLLLRGSKTYYHFLSKRTVVYKEETQKETDITSSQIVLEWFSNYKKFFSEAILAISQTKDISENYNKRMILGILDNIRNYLLISINQQLVNNYDNENVLINLEKINNKILLKKLYKLLEEVDVQMKNICFTENNNLSLEKLIYILENIMDSLNEHYSQFLLSKSKDNYSKDFRAYREIDNFAENYITILLSLDKINEIDITNIGIAGLSYGGIELPILFKVANDKITDISLLKFNQNATGYSKKQSMQLRDFDIVKSGGINLLDVDINKKYILADDNLLTGKTMQLALNIMYDVGIKVDSLSVVRYPSINRVSQMFMKNHGAIDYNMFFDFIHGLCFPSPYSWRDENDYDLYKDSLGVFDLNRKKIIECLVKNHDYSEESELSRYVKKYVKR